MTSIDLWVLVIVQGTMNALFAWKFMDLAERVAKLEKDKK